MPQSDSSVSKTVFLSWLLREVCSFRDAEHFGKFTAKQARAFRSSIRQNTKPAVRQPGPILLVILTFFVNFFFFGIPWTYLVHISNATEYRGRLSSVQQNWDAYINRLIREYTHFLLIVSNFSQAFLQAATDYTQSTVLLS